MAGILDSAPAWVQAFGSIAAIYVAGRTVILASRSARLAKLNGVDAAFKLSLNTAKVARIVYVTNNKSQEKDEFRVEQFTYCKRLLDQVEGGLIEIGSERLPGLTARAQGALENARNAYISAKNAGAGSELQHGYLHTMDKSIASLTELRTEVQRIVARQHRLAKMWWAPWVVDD